MAIGLTAFFLYLDVHNYSWINGQEFVENRYFSISEERFRPNEVKAVEKICWVTIPDNVKKSHLKYVVIGPSGRSFDLGHEPWNDILPLIEEIEGQVGHQTKETTVKLALALKGEPETINTCLKYLKHKNTYDPELKAILWNIFDLD